MHNALDNESSGEGWWVVGGYYVQVDSVSLQERRWGLVARERGYNDKHY